MNGSNKKNLFDSPLICTDPSAVALITAIQANPNRPIPMIALGLISRVRQKRRAVNRT